MTTNDTQAQLMLGLDLAVSDFKDTAIKRVPLLHVCQHAGKRVCNHVHGGIACLHNPHDGKQTGDCCLRKCAASLEGNLNVASHSAKSNNQHNSSLASSMATDKLLRPPPNKQFQSRDFHISLQFGDYQVCGGKSARDAIHWFRAQSKGKTKCTKIRIRDMNITAPYKSQLKISSTLMPASKSLFCLRNARLDHTRHKDSNSCKRVSRVKGSTWRTCADALAAEDECEVGNSTGLAPSETTRESNDTFVDFIRHAQIIRLACDKAGTEDTWNLEKGDHLTMHSEDEYDDDDFDLIPQFDGASDKIADSHKGSDKGKLPLPGGPNACFPVSGDSNNQAPGSDLSSTSDGAWRTGAVERGVGNSQSYSSGSWPQGWPQQSGSGGGSWHGHSQSWSPQQQQQYESWPQPQSLPSAFPPQQTPFRPASPATSFQSPTHNPYASPSHQQTFQASSQYHYPPYQSPPSQSYQQLYQSPPHSYQSPRPSQTFHASQPYSSSSFQSSSGSQTYQSLGASNQSYQLPASNKPYPAATGSQQCGPQSAGLPYQSPPSNHPFQQPASAPTYPSSYQTAHSNQTSTPQHYQSPAHELSQPSWSNQGYSGYNQSHVSGQPGNPDQHLAGSPQHQPGTLYGQPISDNQGNFFSSQGLHQQALSAKPGMTLPETQTSQPGVPPVRQKRVYKKRKESKKAAKLRAAESAGMSPTPVVSTSLLESKSSSIGTAQLTPETRYFQLQNDAKYQPDTTGDKESAVTSGNTSPLTKMSTFEFKPDIASFSSLDSEPSTSKCVQLLNSSGRIGAEKSDSTTTTPMIQQLLMEEPIRMNIKKEDRDVLMKKPIASPTLPKPKRKYKTRVKQSVKTPKRPRSTSLSSPVPPMMGYCGYSPQPIMNPAMIGRPGRSHSISLPFSCEPRMPSPIMNYGWQQWKQHSLPPVGDWQQQQQHHWAMNERQNFDSSGELACSPAEIKSEFMMNKLQHIPSSANAVQPTACSQSLQPSQSPSLFHNQNTFENSLQLGGSSHAYPNRETVSEKSSLSSLFQLISDVGSDDTGWENDSVSIPNLFSNSSDSENHNLTMSVSDINQDSPSAKDFITLETPCKQGYQKAYSDTASEESDRIDLDLASDLKSRTVNRNHSLGSFHPRVGKQNRLKKLGILHTRTRLGLPGNLMDSNPSYTYTFHVPTTLFKKLKFFRSAETRQHLVSVVRMHPMDARRYSLMKIGREIVRVTKLTEDDLASYNVTLPPAHFASADGSTNRVNLDIPIVRADKQTDDDGEKIIFSQFDTDFPPNKVAPPSSFCASQMSIAVTSSAASHRSSAGSNRVQQFAGRSPSNYNGGLSPVSQQGYSSQETTFYCAPQQDELQQIPRGINVQPGSQTLEDTSGANSHQSDQKTNSSYSYPTPSSTFEENHNTIQHNEYMNPQHDQQQDLLEQAGSSGLSPEPKNGLRSLGQHGLTSRIESGRADHISAHQEAKVSDSTSKSSLFNTQVNAQLWDNHAEHMAKCTMAQHAGTCTSQQHLPTFGKDIDNTGQLCKNNTICQEKQTAIKATKESMCCDSHVEGSLSTLSENGHEDYQDEVTNSTHALDNCDASQHRPQLTRLEKHNTEAPPQPDKRRGSLCWRKNRKALSLTIPKYSDLNLPHLEGGHSSSGCTESSQSLDCHKELYEGDDDFVNSMDACVVRRSTRSNTQESESSGVEDKHSTRQAKLRSVYFKSPQNLKPKKRRKRQEPLIEGVHYIVVGKFKGHQSMLVKINKLKVKPTEIFMADYFEELAAKDIVRFVPPVCCPMSRDSDGQSEHRTDIGPHFGHTDSFGSRSAKRGRSMQHIKYRSAKQHIKYRSAKQHAKFRLEEQNAKFKSAPVKPKEILQEEYQTMSPKSPAESKNVMAGPGGASENNVYYPYFVEDKFFSKFKESFMCHCRVKEQAVGRQLKNQENIFFEGIRSGSFQVFQHKFLSNVDKLTSADYSSSSDDEDDVLDRIILKEKIYTPGRPDFQVAGEVPFSKLGEHKHAPVKKDLWPDKPEIGRSFSDHSDNSGFRPHPSGTVTSENSPEGDHSCTKEQIHYNAKDHERNSPCNRNLWQSIGWQDGPQERIDNKGPFISEDNSEVGSKFVLKNLRYSAEEDLKMHCSENISPVTCSSTIKKDGDDKEDYLKCQMAFFEDISSDSDSNLTVITDSYTDKEKLFQRYTPLSFTAPGPLSTKAAIKGEHSPDNHQAVWNVLEMNKDTEHNVSSDLRIDCAQLSCATGPNHKPEVSIPDSEGTSQSVDKVLTKVSGGPGPKLYQEKGATILKLLNQQKNVPDSNVLQSEHLSPVSEAETMDVSALVSTKDSSKCANVCLGASRAPEMRDTPLNTKHNTEAGVSTSQRQTRHGKHAKKSVRDRGSNLHKRRQRVTDVQHSFHDKARATLEIDPFGTNRCLQQRHITSYTHDTGKLDSTDSSASDDEHLTIAVSQNRSSKNIPHSKVEDSKDKRVKTLPNPGRGPKGCPTRGRRKKQTGVNKLLNSLSLLHMATLANLTETQSQMGDDQSNKNYNSATTSSNQDQTFSSISPQISPMLVSSKDKRRLTRKKGCKKDTSLSTKLLGFSEKNFKPEYSAAFNLGSKQPAFSRILSNSTSSSPIPSNFSFTQSSDATQTDAAIPVEDTGTYSTLQLLETRRAQVNCAAFSMKDILELAAQDDSSMESESMNNAPLVKLVEPQRTQKESTSLNISGALKLTSVNASAEMGSSHASSTISLLSNSNHCSDPSLPSTSTASSLSATIGPTNFEEHEETLEASDSLLSQLAKFNTPQTQLSFQTTQTSRSQFSQLLSFYNPLPERCADTASVHSPSWMNPAITKAVSSHVNEDKAPLSSLPVSDATLANTNTDIADSDTNKTQCSDDVKNKYDGDFSEHLTPRVRTMKESHKRTDTPSTPSAGEASPESSNSPDMKCLLSPSPSCSLAMKAAPSTSSNSQNLAHKHIGGLDEASFTPTTGTVVQTAGTKNDSMSCVEECYKPHFDSHSTIPSQVPLQSSVPETPVSAEIDIQNISTTSDDKFLNEKFSSSIPRPTAPKQENRGNHKNLKVRNAFRGVKPLHPLQIPPYLDHGSNTQWEPVFHNAKNASSYYPYCWQWPAYMPSADPAVSPLNLCTTQKSPNNYSPITPTSPISPNYPTQAQGTTESDLSSSGKIGKPLWYPWLKVDTAKPEAKLGSPGNQFRHHHKAYIKTSRMSSTFPVTVNDKEQTPDNLERAQMEPCNIKSDARLISEMPKMSPGSFRGQFSFTRPVSLKLGCASSKSGIAYEPANGDLPSTSCLESSGPASLRALPRKNGEISSVSDSAYWSGDTSGTPDSIDS